MIQYLFVQLEMAQSQQEIHWNDIGSLQDLCNYREKLSNILF